MRTKHDRLSLRNQFRGVGCPKDKSLELAETVIDIKEELIDMMTDIQRNIFTKFDNLVHEQRRESDKLARDIDRRMMKDNLSLVASIVIAGLAIGAAIYFK